MALNLVIWVVPQALKHVYSFHGIYFKKKIMEKKYLRKKSSISTISIYTCGESN